MSEAIEGCSLLESVTLLVSQRDNARNEADHYKAKHIGGGWPDNAQAKGIVHEMIESGLLKSESADGAIKILSFNVRTIPGGWLPIESAPKDFTPVLLVWHPPEPRGAKPCVVLARWNCRKHSLLSRPKRCPNEPDCDMGWDHYAGTFSHWQPLPAPYEPSR